jgi:putative intracellular protease/amidase
MTTRIGIALFDGAEELDWAGPWEVLSYWAHRKPEDDVEVFTVARDNSRPIRCGKGLRVLADHSWASAPEIDVLVYPGGDMSAQVGDEGVRAWGAGGPRAGSADDLRLHRRMGPGRRGTPKGPAGHDSLG